MKYQIFTLVCWMVLGGGLYVTGCAVTDPLIDMIPEKWLIAVSGAAEKGAATGAGTAIVAAEEGDWKTAGGAGIVGIALTAIGMVARASLKRRREKKNEPLQQPG